MSTETKETLMNQIINNIGNLLKDQASINRSQSEMNSELITIVKDLQFRVQQLEEQLNKGNR